MRVAAVQLTSDADKGRNRAAAERLVRAAAADGARLAVLPEMFNVLGDPAVLRDGAEPLDGPTLRWAADLARGLNLWLVAGSVIERVAGRQRCHNTCCLFDPDGQVRAVYRKVHLFDNDVPGAAMRESDTIAPGEEIVAADLGAARLGLAVCYDLRFPELFRALALDGCRVVALPAAFTERTGRDHWDILVRARAIENQVFVIAADQVGQSSPRLRWFGRSMIVDPWGVVLAQAPDGEGYVVADLDFAAQDAVRTQLPCLANRRPDVYRKAPGFPG
jgi:predicted amidohydrolase